MSCLDCKHFIGRAADEPDDVPPRGESLETGDRGGSSPLGGSRGFGNVPFLPRGWKVKAQRAQGHKVNDVGWLTAQFANCVTHPGLWPRRPQP